MTPPGDKQFKSEPPAAPDPTEAPAPTGSASELVRVLDAYMDELRAGRQPDREALLARHPELAPQLEECLGGMDFIHRASHAPDCAPQQLGEFRIVREIGRGGMGAVYEAVQGSLGRRVALKVLRFGGVSDPEAIERFRREAETVAALHHTNIVPIFSVGTQNGVNYYAMQFIEGRSLDEVLRAAGGPLDPRTVAELGLQAAEALVHAHHRDVIHRDVKPSNLILDQEDRVWLTDFGLAKRMNDVTLSMTGALLGTPRYMSPEQASATARGGVDHRTDIYSLGATLYELATGQPLFAGDTPHAVIHQILADQPKPARAHRADLPRDLETILAKCLAKEPSERYGSAKELADDLRAFLDGRAIKARRPSLVEQAGRWLRRQRRSVAIAAIAAVATMAILLGGALAWSLEHRARLAFLDLRTDTPPLVAEVFDRSGRSLAGIQTVPTQQPLEVPSGQVKVRLSGSGQLSRDFRVTLARGERAQYSLRLDDQALGGGAPVLELERAFRLVRLDGKAAVLLMDDERLELVDMASGRSRGTLRLSETFATHALEGSRLRWPWDLGFAFSVSGYDKFDLRPFVASGESTDAADFNGDGHGDLVLAAQHQAWLLAVSGSDATTLWFAPRGSDLLREPGAAGEPALGDIRSATLVPPLLVEDLDDDGVADLVATFGDIGPAAGDQPPRRWVEAISGAAGTTIWTLELPNDWFALPDGSGVPYNFAWFAGRYIGESRAGGGSWRRYSDIVTRSPARQYVRNGGRTYAPDALRQVDGRLVFMAGTRVVAVDPRSGTLLWADETGVRAGMPALWADMDGDGQQDCVLVEERPLKRLWPQGNEVRVQQARLAVWSPARRALLWERDVDGFWPGRPLWEAPPPRWPIAADLDADGAAELIVPNGSSEKTWSWQAKPWGGLDVLDGRTGQSRWHRRVPAMDQRVEHMVAGPDVDGDGVREVFVAALWGEEYDVYIDALSGADGRSLWWTRYPLRKFAQGQPGYWLGGLRWWSNQGGGWPLLLVHAFPEHSEEDWPLVCLISAGTGRVEHVLCDVVALETADADGDKVDDLFALRDLRQASCLDRGGKLCLFESPAHELWWQLAEQSTAAADFDGDQVRDVVSDVGGTRLRAHSGAGGELLWEAELETWAGNRLIRTAADWDLDGDRTADLLVAAHQNGGGLQAPLKAFSGRGGKELWRTETRGYLAREPALIDVKDLDDDGEQEVIFVAAMDWGYGEDGSYSGDDYQLWCLVLSARSGQIRWQQPLSRDYGLRRAGPPPFDFTRLEFDTPYIDLDGDGTLDLIFPAERSGSAPAVEMRAMSGRDGRGLWRFSLPALGDTDDALANARPVAVADLDADGNQEVIVLYFEDSRAAENPRRIAHLSVLDAQSGERRWDWKREVATDFGEIAGHGAGWGGQGAPLLVRRGSAPPLIAVKLRDPQLGVWLIDAAGAEAGRFPLQPEPGGKPDAHPLVALDADGDGADELLTLAGDALVLVEPQQNGSERWRFALPDGPRELLHSEPAAASRRAAIVVASGSHVFGIDGASGQPRWASRGSATPTAGRLDPPDAIALLSEQATDAARVFFRRGDVAMCREAGVPSGSLARTDVLLQTAPRDPRLLRRPPWVPPHNDAIWQFARTMVWGSGLCAALLVLPLGYVWRLVRRRRWSLRMMLALPAVAAVALFAMLVPVPDDTLLLSGIDFFGSRFSTALMVFPFWAFLAAAIWLAARGKRKTFVALLALAAGGALLIALVSLAFDQSIMMPGERYTWQSWYWIWVIGVYLSGVVVVIAAPIWFFGTKLYRVIAKCKMQSAN